MLFQTIDEIKEHIAVNLSFDIKDVKPYITLVEERDVIPMISKAEFDTIQNLVDNPPGGGLSAIQQEFLDKLRTIIANLAFVEYIPIGNVQISSSGIHISMTENKKTAFQWQVEEVRESLLKVGFNAMDRLLEFMELNKASFPDWVASDGYAETKELFIKNARDFSKQYHIAGSTRTFIQLKPIMKIVEQLYISTTICEDFYLLLKQEILTDTVSSVNQKAIDHIKPVIAHFTVSRAVADLPIKLTASGITINRFGDRDNIKIKEPAKDAQLNMLHQSAKSNGETFMAMLKDFLDKNADDYPVYKNSDCYSAQSTEPRNLNKAGRKTYIV